MSTIRKINKSSDIDSKFKQGTETIHKPEHKKAIRNMNDAMGVVRKDYKLKDRNSRAAASLFILTC